MTAQIATSVLLCAKAYPPVVGGVESYAEHVAQAYQQAGVRPTIITSFPGRPGRGYRHYDCGEIEVVNVGDGSQPAVLLRLLMAVYRELRTQQFDFYHATTWRGGVALLPWLRGKRSVVTVHGREVLINSRAMRLLLDKTLPRFGLIAAVSDYTRSRLLAAQPSLRSQTTTIVSYNGLSYREEAKSYVRPPSEGVVRIYSFCRLVERKNILGAIKAAGKLWRDGLRGFEYVISGTGPLRAELQAAIDDAGLGACIHMTGYVAEEDVAAAFQKADIFLHPQIVAADGNDVEGFGLVIADAMSFGAVPIVGKDGGPADFIVDGMNGFIVDGNDVDEISRVLARLITDPAQRHAAAVRAREWAIENLSWQQHVTQILAALE